MDNYKDTFLKKLKFVLGMVYIYSVYRIPKDWWNVAIVKEKGDSNTKYSIHGYGTTFKIERLDKMFRKEYEYFLEKANMEVKEGSKGIYYKLKAPKE